MKDDKYYTPIIEEFYYGFNYEMIPSTGYFITDLFKDSVTTYATEYQEGIFGIKSVNILLGDNFSTIIDGIKNKKVRVKYLDKEDIESLGFIKSTINNQEVFSKIIKNYRGLGERTVTLINRITILITIDGVDFLKSNTILTGTIKNKSELFKALKMIGVYETE